MFIEIKKYCLLLSSDYPLIILYKKILHAPYLLNFTTKCIGGQIKAFSFLFCTACDAKSTKYGER